MTTKAMFSQFSDSCLVNPENGIHVDVFEREVYYTFVDWSLAMLSEIKRVREQELDWNIPVSRRHPENSLPMSC